MSLPHIKRRNWTVMHVIVRGVLMLALVVTGLSVLVQPSEAATYDSGYESTATGNSDDGTLADCDVDQWNTCRRNCTSYVAYRLNAAGVPFNNNYKGVRWGDAHNWDDAARAVGIPTGSTPKVGAVGYWNKTSSNQYGHVAWVEGVNADGSVRTSNYNGFTEQFYTESAARPHGYIYFGNAGVGASAPASNGTPRIATLSSGQLAVKEGPINATWTQVGGGTSFKMSSNRIALYSGGQLSIKEGPINAMWVTVTGAVDAYEVTNNRVGILVGGKLFIKDGPLNATWTQVAEGVSSFKLSPNRIAAYINGQLLVKEGPINAGWVTVTGNVSSFDVTDNRVGIMVNGQLHIKEGGLGATWVHVGGGSSFKLSPSRIAVYNGQLVIKEGPINAGWVTVTGGVDAYDVTDGRVGILIGGQLHVKDGPLGATWTHVGGGSSFDLT